ncbi:hypothetical protein HWV62_13333 [Athelia sp. TMB]|nr:hypothetical protein HWV62_13333 [Athelia sp. TMB]
MATAEESPLKRKREEPDVALTGSAGLIRSDIWYDDGNVILQAEGTLFRVHRGVLARSSPVFKDMFLFPQPPFTGMKMMDECPVVQLSDSAEEVGYILEGIFERKYVAFAEKLPLAVISAFICLGKKYDIRTLYLEAVKKLFEEVPATLAEYDGPTNEKWNMIDDPEYMDVAILARKAGLLSILPGLLFVICSDHSSDEIKNGFLMPDGRTKRLSIQDQFACLGGYRAICETQAETTFSWFLFDGTVSSACLNEDDCTRVKGNWVCETFLKPTIKALDLWNHLSIEGLCDECCKDARRYHEAGRAEFWEKLPSLFGLPPWSELLEEREDM